MAGPDLTARIARRIRVEGPISVAAFMAMALHDRVDGYYARHQPIGGAGDFITAPEISQIFGEMIGLWCADAWRQMGSPDPVILAELGPGRGVLMQDLLRAAAGMPGFREALRLYLLEASPVLRREQQHRLAGASPRFVTDLTEIPDGPLLLVANEFFDALPIRQFVRGRTGWVERLVGLDHRGGLAFVDGREDPIAALLVPAELRDAAPGTLLEICPAAAALAASIGERLARHPGAALIVDYGYFPRKPGPTLAALRRHQAASVLDEPGSADLSAHVDFATLGDAAIASGAVVSGPDSQGAFLTALGAATRLTALSRRASPGQRQALAIGLRRLIDPDQMGTLFKVMAIQSPGLLVPAGFADRFRPEVAAAS